MFQPQQPDSQKSSPSPTYIEEALLTQCRGQLLQPATVSKAQLTNVISQMLIAYLKKRHLINSYKIEKYQDQLSIRVSTSNPPTNDEKNQFNELINEIKQSGLFSLSDLINEQRTVTVKGKVQRITINYWNVININVNNMSLMLMRVNQKIAAPNVAQDIWDNVPDNVKLRWSGFSQVLQKHILECAQKQEPILVYLPIKSAGIYNLSTQVLKFEKKCNPDGKHLPSLRQDPTSQEWFSIGELIPVPSPSLSKLSVSAESSELPFEKDSGFLSRSEGSGTSGLILHRLSGTTAVDQSKKPMPPEPSNQQSETGIECEFRDFCLTAPERKSYLSGTSAKPGKAPEFQTTNTL